MPEPADDWKFDVAMLALLVAAMVATWALCRYVPGAPLNLLTRVQTLEAHAARCCCEH